MEFFCRAELQIATRWLTDEGRSHARPVTPCHGASLTSPTCRTRGKGVQENMKCEKYAELDRQVELLRQEFLSSPKAESEGVRQALFAAQQEIDMHWVHCDQCRQHSSAAKPKTMAAGQTTPNLV